MSENVFYIKEIVTLKQESHEATDISLKNSGGDGTSGGMEARVARLESDVEHIKTTTGEIRLDIRELRKKIDDHFLILGGMIVAVALGLAGLLAKGFHWLG